MFVCKDCGQERQPISPFAKSGQIGCCDECRAERRRQRNKDYYEANKLKLNQTQRLKRGEQRRAVVLEKAKEVAAATVATDLDRALALLANPQIRAALREVLKEDLGFLD